MTVTYAPGFGISDPNATPAPVQSAQARELARAVGKLNGSSLLPSNQELSLSIDPKTKIPVVRVLDAITHEVLNQLPAEYVLRVTAFLESQATQDSLSKTPTPGR